MLLRFIVENLFCFAEETTFSMVATKDDALPKQVMPGLGDRYRVLRTAALYGANAHGKSKLLEAMKWAQKLIVDGTRTNKKIPVQPFRLDPELRNKPSRIEFTILVEGVEYTYGFVVDAERIHEEWLFSRPNAREVKWFERVTDAKLETRIEVGPALARKGSKDREFVEFLIRGLRANQLFLTEGVERNFKKFEAVYDWFEKKLHIVSPDGSLLPIAHFLYKSDEFCRAVSEFIGMADTGIAEIGIKRKISEVLDVMSKVPDRIRADLEKHLEKGAVLSDETGMSALFTDQDGLSELVLVAKHQSLDGTLVDFEIKDESSGTRRLLQLLPILFGGLVQEKIFIVDELDRTLHPALSRFFIESFVNNTIKRQLVITTHETSLLDLNLLRRDEIWFVEKDPQGKAQVYPLSSFKVRPDLRLERGYLQGRFGAIPFIGSPESLGWFEGVE
ncbi:MAG: ATP-binding protein [Magnetococcales bacterium]|nr:ATP-binding protein [Magnetococcales bacterium]